MANNYITYPTRINSTTGQEEIVELGKWAKDTLSESEYTLFLASADRQAEIVSQAGTVIETVRTTHNNYFKTDVNRAIGINVSVETPVTHDEEWFGFWGRYVADPSLTWTERP
jgi:hypothetical protein